MEQPTQQQQMTPQLKCKTFLSTLLRLAGQQNAAAAANVRDLVQGLVDGTIEPEVFASQLVLELDSSPQPCLAPFLRGSLPHLRRSLRSGELIIEGIRGSLQSS